MCVSVCGGVELALIGVIIVPDAYFRERGSARLHGYSKRYIISPLPAPRHAPICGLLFYLPEFTRRGPPRSRTSERGMPAPLILGHGELKEPVAGGVFKWLKSPGPLVGLMNIGPLKWERLR